MVTALTTSAHQQLIDNASRDPVVLVGQPRSGSTLLTRVLNEAPSLFIINDFYVLQKIDAEGLWGELSTADAARIAQWIYERIFIRATQERGKTLEQSIDLDPKALERLALLASGPWPRGSFWHEVLAALMTAAASEAGAVQWGYNTPQDYLHLHRLFAAYPRAKVLFLLRDPSEVLRSYKSASGQWHDPTRYNPLGVAMAWRSASRSLDTWSEARPGQVLFVNYGELVSQTEQEVDRLARFLRVDFPAIELNSFGRNSSFAAGRQGRVVTPSELWVAKLLLAAPLTQRNLPPVADGRLRLRDLPELARISVSSMTFLLRSLLDSDRRTRLLRLFAAQSKSSKTPPSKPSSRS